MSFKIPTNSFLNLLLVKFFTFSIILTFGLTALKILYPSKYNPLLVFPFSMPFKLPAMLIS